MDNDKPRYDFYENNMFLDDPMAADLSRKEKCKAPKIGTEPRVRSINISQNMFHRCNLIVLNKHLALSTCPRLGRR